MGDYTDQIDKRLEAMEHAIWLLYSVTTDLVDNLLEKQGKTYAFERLEKARECIKPGLQVKEEKKLNWVQERIKNFKKKLWKHITLAWAWLGQLLEIFLPDD